MSREPVRVECDGLSRLVYRCSLPGCNSLCDPDFDSTFLCSGHLAMVPQDMLTKIDFAMSEASWEGFDIAAVNWVKTVLDEVLAYAAAADAVINGEGLA